MKILVPGLVLGFLAALVLYVLTAMDAGYVRISWGHWLIETNLILFSLMVLIGAFLISGSFRLIRRFIRSGSLFGQFMSGQRARRSRSKSSQGMLAYLEGNWAQAKKLLSQSADHAESPLVNYLAAAHAANELGQTSAAQALLQKASACSQASDFAVGLTQARLQLERQELEPCLGTLQRLRQQQPQHPLVLNLLRSVYQRTEDWQPLTQLLPELRKLPHTQKQNLDELEIRAWLNLFRLKTEKLKHNGQSGQPEASEALARLWRKVPESLRFASPLIASYAKQLIALGFEAEGETLLRKAIGKHWDETLITLYGLIEGADVAEQLATAETWLKHHPDNAALLLALGRLSQRNALWGKAMDYLEASHRIQPDLTRYAELYRLKLCRLNSHLHADANSQKQWQEGLFKALNLPKLPLPDPRNLPD